METLYINASEASPEVIYTDNSLEFGKACEHLQWDHCTSTLHRPETDGIAEGAVRTVTEGTSAILLQSGLDEKWWADLMGYVTVIFATFKTSFFLIGKLQMNGDLENNFAGQSCLFDR